MNLKVLIPSGIKLKIKITQEKWRNYKSGNTKLFAKPTAISANFKFSINKTQEIKKTSSFDAKLHNLKTGSKLIETVQINPKEIFSFWDIIGNPNKKNRFKSGRAILNGELSKSIGGGLCQLSGLIYHICLDANLKIIERHNHSLDLYLDKDRYSPLGADATVAYGYKDLKFINNYDFPIRFSFEIELDKIKIYLLSTQKIKPSKIIFTSKKINENRIKVNTLINDIKMEESWYQINN